MQEQEHHPAEEVEEVEEEKRPEGIPYFELQHRFQDLVEKTPWNGCGFSTDGEYVIGGQSLPISLPISLLPSSSISFLPFFPSWLRG